MLLYYKGIFIVFKGVLIYCIWFCNKYDLAMWLCDKLQSWFYNEWVSKYTKEWYYGKLRLYAQKYSIMRCTLIYFCKVN